MVTPHSFHQKFIKKLHGDKDNATRLREEIKEKTHLIHVGHLLRTYGLPVAREIFQYLANDAVFQHWASNFYSPWDYQKNTEAIMSYSKRINRDPAELVLQVLANRQNPDVMVWDVIKYLQDNALQSVNEKISDFITHEGIICEPPVRWEAEMPLSVKELNEYSAEIHRLTLSRKSKKTDQTPKGLVFLTFVEDGESTAKEVKKFLSTPERENGRAFKVYFLRDFTRDILEGDEEIKISHYLKSCDFVVPILSPDYMKMLTINGDGVFKTSLNVDAKYAPLIYRFLLSEWSSDFKNRRIRCLLPDGSHWPENMIVYPPFRSFVTNISELRFLLRKSKRKTVH